MAKYPGMGPYVDADHTISDDDFGKSYVGSNKQRQLHRKRKQMMRQNHKR